MIEAQNISKWFGPTLAVSDVSFTVERGEVLGFLGPNGAGKSTTMRMLTGFLPLSGGSVSVGGHDIEEDPIEAAHLMIGSTHVTEMRLSPSILSPPNSGSIVWRFP